MTAISFERSGGLAGAELHLELKLDEIPQEEAKRLQALIDEARFFTIQTPKTTSTQPDEFHYVITINDGNQSHTVRTTESTAPRELQPLIKELTMQKLLS